MRSRARSNLSIKPSSFTNNKRPSLFAIIYKYLSVNSRLVTLLNPYISIIAIGLCFFPILLSWWKKLNEEKAFFFVAIYWLINGITNLPLCLGQSENSSLLNQITLFYNLLDTPLILLIFYFSASGKKKKMLFYLLICFTLFELAMVLWKGYNFDSSTIIAGTGDILALIYCIWGIAQYFQKIEHSNFETTMGFIYAGYLFVYGVFAIIFIFNYLNFRKETVDSNLFLYYLSIILATLLTSFGFWKHAKSKQALDY